MLKPAILYKDELQELYINTWYDERYKFYYTQSFRDSLVIADSNWNNIEFASIDKNNKVTGFIGCRISRGINAVTNIGIINFDLDSKNITFAKDVFSCIHKLLFEFNFNKINTTVIIGNPIEKSYDRLYLNHGGRIVGTYEEEFKLSDGKYYDVKVYELLKRNFKPKIK